MRVPLDLRCMASLQVFLCSRAADYITGTVLKVDGGYTNGMALPFAVHKEQDIVAAGSAE